MRNMVNNKNNLKEQLKDKLKEIFQFEDEDLDFGIYRIMNYKRKEIKEFIEEKLINEIKRQLELVSEDERNKIKEKLEEMSAKNGVKKYLDALEKGDEERVRIYEEDFAKDIEEYKRLKRQFEEIKITEDLEKGIYNHLINFFSRYYDQGDFITKRRYGKAEKYVVPYNGEEVLLYWVNKDQYYIKTTEYFRKYTFKTKEGITVNFRVVEAEEEKGNVKSTEKKYFVLNERIYDFDEKNKELNIFFEYRGLAEEEEKKYKSGNTVSQEKINDDIIKVLDEKLPKNSTARVIFNGENGKKIIEKHLYRFTRRNTTDYFIHKDLKGFLERELDFYIKNEFLDLEDLQVLNQGGYFEKLRLCLIGIRAFRNIALKIIDFLAQIENFQKKLWEKKKFVIDTHYVITLDKIKEYAGEEFLESILDEILSNEKQLEEWKELFEIEVKREEDLIANNGQLQLNSKEWKKLPIDTKYFDEEFKWKLLVALSEKNDLDEILDGFLIKSENFQALNLLLNKYYEKVQTIYIDPPFNTGSDDFVYKDNYQHSSWLTMMENRLRFAKELMKEDGVIFVSIDDNELKNLVTLSLSLGYSFIANFIRKSGIAPRQDVKFIAIENDYVLCLAKDIEKVRINKQPTVINESRYPYFDDFVNERGQFTLNKLDRGSIHYSEKLDYPVTVNKGEMIEIIDLNTKKAMLIEAPEDIKLWPGGDPEDKRWTWRWSRDKVEWGLKNRMIIFKKVGDKWSVYFKQYQYVDNNLNPISREIPHRSLLLDFTNEIANGEIKSLFGDIIFPSYPKPVPMVYHLLKIGCENTDFILDFFAGSGTTAHAVMKLNKEDGGRRKFILVETADYFNTVIIPRIKKVAYSFNWKEGKPQDMDGIGVFFKYHTLEQYEDALENIEFEEQNEQQKKILYELPDYFVKYMLQWETKQSSTFLNLEKLKNPFDYKLKIIENYEPKEVNVDIIETFNYLLGIKVKTYKVLNENGRRYVFVFGEKENRKIAIIWRSIENIDLEKDKEIIKETLKEFSPDEIYINGDAIVEGFKAIEPLFKTLMLEEM